MRGIILAGGTGSRLGALTKVVNKHLLPVGGVPMVYYPLRVLRDNGIEDITVVSSPDGVGQLAALLGSGAEHGCEFTYRVQDQPGGIAAALVAAGNCGGSVAVVLGDNVFIPSPVLKPGVSAFRASVFLAKADDLSGFGVPCFHPAGKHIEGVFEKPKNPPSEYAVTGLYLFGPDVFCNLRELKPSARGELEITDLLHSYAQRRRLNHTVFDGFWGDAGTVEGMRRCEDGIWARE